MPTDTDIKCILSPNCLFRRKTRASLEVWIIYVFMCTSLRVKIHKEWIVRTNINNSLISCIEINIDSILQHLPIIKFFNLGNFLLVISVYRTFDVCYSFSNTPSSCQLLIENVIKGSDFTACLPPNHATM